MANRNQYFQKVLDDIVSLNGLFTVAVFIGLSFAQPGNVQSLADDPSCDPDTTIRKRLVFYEIVSFSCFIFAGFLGKAVKVFLYTSRKKKARKGKEEQQGESPSKEHKGIRLFGFYLSIYGTILGCLMLLLAMINVVQIKLGRLSCRSSKYAVTTVFVMVGFIGLSLLIFFFAVSNGLWIAVKNKGNKRGICPPWPLAHNV